MIIGLDAYEAQAFESPTSGVRDISYLELSNSVIDEVHIRERTDIAPSSTKTTWQPDTRLKFTADEENLEAGNVQNESLEIVEFVLKRREIDSVESLTIARIPFENNSVMTYDDYLQANREYVYSVQPVSSNGLEGRPIETSIISSFVGFHLIDKNDTTNIFSFDKFIGSPSEVGIQFEEDRTEVKTFSKYPNVFYSPSEFHRFGLSAAFLPEDNKRSNAIYQKLLATVKKREPLMVKGSDGSLFIVDVYSPNYNVPQNSWEGHDYITISIQCVETMDEKEYVEG